MSRSVVRPVVRLVLRAILFCRIGRYDLIYYNTVGSLEVLPFLKHSAPSLFHLHRLLIAFQTYRTSVSATTVIRRFRRILVVSPSVKDELEQIYGISDETISVVPSIVEVPEQITPVDLSPIVGTAEFVVGGSGYVSWIKGSDLFIQTAYIVKKRNPRARIAFIWVGNVDAQKLIEISWELRNAQLHETVFFVGLQAEPLPYYAAFDVFFMSSREESFGMAAAEAMSIGVPVISFRGPSPLNQIIVDHEAGFVVPYLDVEASAEAVLSLYEKRDLRTRISPRASELRSIFSAESVSPGVARMLDDVALSNSLSRTK